MQQLPLQNRIAKRSTAAPEKPRLPLYLAKVCGSAACAHLRRAADGEATAGVAHRGRAADGPFIGVEDVLGVGGVLEVRRRLRTHTGAGIGIGDEPRS